MFENRFISTRPAAPALKDRLLEVAALGLACLLAVTVLIRAHRAGNADAAAPAGLHAVPTARAAPVAPQPAAPRSPTEEDVRRILQDMALHD